MLFAGPGRRDVMVNILLFMPFGVLVYHDLVLKGQVRSVIFVSVVAGGVLSLMIELLQMLTPRHPTISDVMANALGSGCGALLAALCPPRAAELGRAAWGRVKASGLVVGLALLCAATPLLLSVVQFIAPFGIWNSRFSFQIGNEATLDRPWLGKIYFVAVYERALAAHEVSERFHQGIPHGASYLPRRSAPVAVYTFTEREGGVVHDQSRFASPLDLEIIPKSHVRWLDSAGLELVRPAVLKSREPGTKLVKSLSASRELSIEAWVAPKNIAQRGPARIVSLSQDGSARNFTLGQEGREVNFRVRTPITGLNGSSPSLRTADGLWSEGLVHLLASYREGVQRVFINGVERVESLDLNRDGITGFGARKTGIGRLAYSFFFFAPVSFFCAAFVSGHAQTFMRKLSIPIMIATSLLSATELMQAFLFDRAVDSQLILCGAVISSIMGFAGMTSAPVSRQIFESGNSPY